MEKVAFPWDENYLVEKIYNKDNYRIVNTGAEGNNVLILCSGNGLYFPNEEEVFCKTICEKDRYEWENVASDPLVMKYYSKIIFIRDIYKQWYVTGINAEINTMDKLILFLKGITEGYRVTVCGNSAGGYVAVIIGILLQAEVIYNFSGQYNLYNEFESAPFLRKYSGDKERAKYYKINEIIPIQSLEWERVFYFYPTKSEEDMLQVCEVQEAAINFFPIDSGVHGVTVRGSCYPYLLTQNRDAIKKICNSKGSPIKPKEIEKNIPMKYRWNSYVRIAKRVLKKRLFYT